MLKNTDLGWAIKMKFDWGWAFLGRYYFTEAPSDVRPFHSGLRTAFFDTRRLAREAICRHQLKGAQVVRVQAVISEVKTRPIPGRRGILDG